MGCFACKSWCTGRLACNNRLACPSRLQVVFLCLRRWSMLYMSIVLSNGDFNLVSLRSFVQPSWPETEIFPSAARAEKGVLKGDQWGLNLLMLNISRCFFPPFLPGFSGPMLHQLRVASANAQTLKIHVDACCHATSHMHRCPWKSSVWNLASVCDLSHELSKEWDQKMPWEEAIASISIEELSLNVTCIPKRTITTGEEALAFLVFL